MQDKLKTKILYQISKIFKENDFSSIVEFLINCRKLIESDNELKQKFPVLFFYSNWIAHSVINRNQNIYKILEKISLGFTGLGIPNSEYNVKFKDYISVVIDALDLDGLLLNTVDFIYSIIINNYMITLNGVLTINDIEIEMSKEEQLKFLLENGNLDVGISFIKKEEGVEVRKQFLLSIFQKLTHITIKFPENLKDKNKESIVDNVKKLAEDFKFTGDTTYIIIKSLVIDGVTNNQVFIDLEMDDNYHKENVHIQSSFFISNC